MNEGHRFFNSPGWNSAVRDHIVAWAVGEVDLGDALPEQLRGTGFADVYVRVSEYGGAVLARRG